MVDSVNHFKLQMERECTENNEHFNWIINNEPDSKRAQKVKATQDGYQVRFYQSCRSRCRLNVTIYKSKTYLKWNYIYKRHNNYRTV